MFVCICVCVSVAKFVLCRSEAPAKYSRVFWREGRDVVRACVRACAVCVCVCVCVCLCACVCVCVLFL